MEAKIPNLGISCKGYVLSTCGPQVQLGFQLGCAVNSPSTKPIW